MTSRRTSVLKKLAAILLVGALWGCESNPFISSPSTSRVKTQRLDTPCSSIHLKFSGRVKPAEPQDLAFGISGRLVELPCQAGKHVKKGDLLARLDPGEFKSHLDAAEMAVARGRAKMDILRAASSPDLAKKLAASVIARRDKMRDSQIELKQFQKLLRTGVVSRLEFEKASKTFADAKTAYDQAQEDVALAKTGKDSKAVAKLQGEIQALETSLDQARAAFGQTELRAPCDGVIQKSYAANHQEVKATQPVASILDEMAADVVLELPNSFVDTLTEDLPHTTCAVYLVTLPEHQMEGRVHPPAAHRPAGQQTCPILVSISCSKEMKVAPGAGAQVSFVRTLQSGPTASPAFTLPVSAVIGDDRGRSYVWTMDEETQRVSRREVVVRYLQGENILVNSGLRIGETVAVAGIDKFYEGKRVR